MASLFLAPLPGAFGRGQKAKYHLISITKSISKICIPNFVCSHKCKIQNVSDGFFLFCCLGHAPGVGPWGTLGAQVIKKNQTWSCGISNRQG